MEGEKGLPPLLLRWKCREKGLFKNSRGGTSLVVQQLRLHAPSTGSLGSIPGQGTRACMPQLRACMLQLKIQLKDPTCHNEDPACCN